MTASGILFKEWASMTVQDSISTVAGFLVIMLGIYLLHTFKDANISLDQVTMHLVTPTKKTAPLLNSVTSSDAESNDN